MKNKDVISSIVNDLRALTVDDRVSERFVLSKLREYLALYLKRENDTLRLFYYDGLWTTIDCVEMEEVSTLECLGITSCKITKFTRSKCRIPELYSYKNGPLIREIMTIDGGSDYQPSSPKDFNKILKREFMGSTKYYWFSNGHLILPDGPDVVTFTGCFISQSEALSMSGCNPLECIEIMEDEFPCPPHLLSTVKQDTLKDLYNFYKRNVLDNVPDLDQNNKTEKGGQQQ